MQLIVTSLFQLFPTWLITAPGSSRSPPWATDLAKSGSHLNSGHRPTKQVVGRIKTPHQSESDGDDFTPGSLCCCLRVKPNTDKVPFCFPIPTSSQNEVHRPPGQSSKRRPPLLPNEQHVAVVHVGLLVHLRQQLGTKLH